MSRLHWSSSWWRAAPGRYDGPSNPPPVSPTHEVVEPDVQVSPRDVSWPMSPDAFGPTDRGIGKGDSLTELRAAYPGRLIRDEGLGGGATGTEQFLGVSGERSHLVFYVIAERVVGFYLTPGAVSEGDFAAAIRGISC